MATVFLDFGSRETGDEWLGKAAALWKLEAGVHFQNSLTSQTGKLILDDKVKGWKGGISVRLARAGKVLVEKKNREAFFVYRS